MADEQDPPPKLVKRRPKNDPRGPLLTRRLASVTPEDTETSGRPLLWAYGRGWLLRVSGRKPTTLHEAIKAGLDPSNPVEAVAWALEKRGRPDLAAQVRETLRPSNSDSEI